MQEIWLPGCLAMTGLILASGFFSSSETALFFLSREDLRAFRVGRRARRNSEITISHSNFENGIRPNGIGRLATAPWQT